MLKIPPFKLAARTAESANVHFIDSYVIDNDNKIHAIMTDIVTGRLSSSKLELITVIDKMTIAEHCNNETA